MGEGGTCGGQEVLGNSLYFLLKFSENKKLFLKIKFINKIHYYFTYFIAQVVN